jgi:hypothetical protein
LEESAIAHAKGNQPTALEKAKEAAKRERKLTKYRDANNMAELQNSDLTYPFIYLFIFNKKKKKKNLIMYFLSDANSFFAHSQTANCNYGINKSFLFYTYFYFYNYFYYFLRYAVIFNLAHQYHQSGMYQESLNTYQVLVKNKQFANAGRLRVNMGNVSSSPLSPSLPLPSLLSLSPLPSSSPFRSPSLGVFEMGRYITNKKNIQMRSKCIVWL